MKTMKDIKLLKYDMLTLSNVSRGYSNSKAFNEVKRVDGELDKLEAVYSNDIISEDLKNEYILDQLNLITWTADDSELMELLEGRPDDSYYNDASMTWIHDYIYNVFINDNTLKEIDYKIEYMFGHYSGNYLVENNDQFYVLFEW